MKESQKQRMLATANKVYSVGQGVVKLGLSVLSGGAYKPHSGLAAMSYQNAQKRAEEHIKRAEELEKKGL